MSSASPYPHSGAPNTNDQWYFSADEIRNCPSFRDGMSQGEIEEKRLKGYEFIRRVAKTLRFEGRALATVVMYFQRFFQFHSFRKFGTTEVAATCLFLGSKVEEIRVSLAECAEAALAHRSIPPKKPDQESCLRWQKIITELEMLLLRTLCYDLVIEHPYDHILKTCLRIPLEEKGKQKIAQSAWNFVNDSLPTTIVLEFKPEMIAVAAMYMAAVLHLANEKAQELKSHLGYQDRHKKIVERITAVYEKDKQHLTPGITSSNPSPNPVTHAHSPPNPTQPASQSSSVSATPKPASPISPVSPSENHSAAKGGVSPVHKSATPPSAPSDSSNSHSTTGKASKSPPGQERYSPYPKARPQQPIGDHGRAGAPRVPVGAPEHREDGEL